MKPWQKVRRKEEIDIREGVDAGGSSREIKMQRHGVGVRLDTVGTRSSWVTDGLDLKEKGGGG